MHILIGIGLVTGLIAFAFGPDAAKVFAGIILSLCAAAVLAFIALIAHSGL